MHDWHMCDVEQNLEVTVTADGVQLRRADNPDVVMALAPEQWDVYRAGDEQVRAEVLRRLT